jgi:hypothetical protein
MRKFRLYCTYVLCLYGLFHILRSFFFFANSEAWEWMYSYYGSDFKLLTTKESRRQRWICNANWKWQLSTLSHCSTTCTNVHWEFSTVTTSHTNSYGHVAAGTVHRLEHLWEYVTPWLGNLTGRSSCMLSMGTVWRFPKGSGAQPQICLDVMFGPFQTMSLLALRYSGYRNTVFNYFHFLVHFVHFPCFCFLSHAEICL